MAAHYFILKFRPKRFQRWHINQGSSTAFQLLDVYDGMPCNSHLHYSIIQILLVKYLA